jgi:predicted HicB family RNase H-like nuclease
MNTPRRQPGNEIVRVELRLDPDDHRRVKAAADNQDRSMHSLLIHIVRQWLRENPEGD